MSDQILTASALAQSLRDEELAEARRMADLAQDQAETLRRLLKQAQAALEAHEQRAEAAAYSTGQHGRLDQKQLAAMLEAMGLPPDAAWTQILQWVENTRQITMEAARQNAEVRAALDLKQSTSHDAVIREIKKLASVRVSPQ